MLEQQLIDFVYFRAQLHLSQEGVLHHCRPYNKIEVILKILGISEKKFKKTSIWRILQVFTAKEAKDFLKGFIEK